MVSGMSGLPANVPRCPGSLILTLTPGQPRTPYGNPGQVPVVYRPHPLFSYADVTAHAQARYRKGHQIINIFAAVLQYYASAIVATY